MRSMDPRSALHRHFGHPSFRPGHEEIVRAALSGHDFRPDYRALADAAHRCRRADGAPGRPPILAFTATATPEVKEDIVRLLGLEDPEIFAAGFDRPNLFLDVRKVSGEIEKRALLP